MHAFLNWILKTPKGVEIGARVLRAPHVGAILTRDPSWRIVPWWRHVGSAILWQPSDNNGNWMVSDEQMGVGWLMMGVGWLSLSCCLLLANSFSHCFVFLIRAHVFDGSDPQKSGFSMIFGGLNPGIESLHGWWWFQCVLYFHPENWGR